MMRATTHKGVQTAVHTIPRRYIVDCLDIHTARLSGKWYVDWISAGTKSLDQNSGYLVLYGVTFTEVYPSDSNQQVPVHMYLNYFCNYVGIPEKLESDRDPELFGRNFEFLKSAKQK